MSLENKSSTKQEGPYDADTLSDVTFGLLNIADLNVIRVKPIHPSLQTFVTNPTTPHPSELRDFFPDKEFADAKMATMCLRQLMLDIEPRDCWDTCLFYCARYFNSHINRLSTLPEDLQAILKQILIEKPEIYLKRILAWRFTAHEYEFPKVTCLGNPSVINPVVFLDCVGLSRLKETFSSYISYDLRRNWRLWPKDCYF